MSNRQLKELFSKRDSVIVNFICRMPETCCLDVADRGPHTLRETSAAVVNLQGGGHYSHEAIRLMQEAAVSKLKRSKLLMEHWRMLDVVLLDDVVWGAPYELLMSSVGEAVQDGLLSIKTWC